MIYKNHLMNQLCSHIKIRIHFPFLYGGSNIQNLVSKQDFITKEKKLLRLEANKSLNRNSSSIWTQQKKNSDLFSILKMGRFKPVSEHLWKHKRKLTKAHSKWDSWEKCRKEENTWLNICFLCLNLSNFFHVPWKLITYLKLQTPAKKQPKYVDSI